uniref:Protein krueppel n=1 Tax=Timema douglasi TaxID=61478 RepID=A0A7R8VRV5_TIMDO|nr:unnamed protein product [Timema douglasi]
MSSESDTDIINYGGSPLTEPMDLVCLKREIDLNHDQELDVDPRSKLIVQLEDNKADKAGGSGSSPRKGSPGKSRCPRQACRTVQTLGRVPEPKTGCFARQIKTWVCRICNKQFTMRGDLRAHERIHTGEKPYRCTHCDKRFNRSNNLKTHLRTHTGERPFSCLECGRAFSQREHLRTHMRTHTGEKPFSCELCAVQFTRSCDLTRHVRTHTGDKPYACEVCEKRFTKNNNLVAHRRTHEVAHGEKAEGRLNVLMHVETHSGRRRNSYDVAELMLCVFNI